MRRLKSTASGKDETLESSLQEANYWARDLSILGSMSMTRDLDILSLASMSMGGDGPGDGGGVDGGDDVNDLKLDDN